MKMRFMVMILISVFVLANTAQATLINVLDLTGSLDIPTDEHLLTCTLSLGRDYPIAVGTYNIDSEGIIQSTKASSMLIDMFQRTFNPDPELIFGSNRDFVIQEQWTNYMSDEIRGGVLLGGNHPYGNSFFIPLPDLSQYRINDLYVGNSIIQHGSTVDYDVSILADVAPVPEPLSFLLVSAGLAGIGFMRRKTGNKTS